MSDHTPCTPGPENETQQHEHPEAEFDLEELAPTMRSVEILRGPASVPSLPTHYDRHQGAYLYRVGAGPSGSSGGGNCGSSLSHLVVPTHPKTQQNYAAPTLRPASSISSSAATSMTEKVESLAAPKMPFEMALFPLERCHYYTNKSAEDLHTDIEAALQEKGVVFNFVPAKFKFACEYRTGVNMVRFVCRAYFVPEDGRTVVEFQRRAGCCIVCAKVVDAVRSTLLARECNAEAAPIAIRAFQPKPLYITACLLHEKSQAEAPSRQLAQQCTLMDDLRRCMAEGKDAVLTDFAVVLVPLSQLAPQRLLGDPSNAELLAALGQHVNVPNARLSALVCLANLAAICFPVSVESIFSLPSLRRCASSDPDNDVTDDAAANEPGPSVGEVCAWFDGVLLTLVRTLDAESEEDGNPHFRREAARALLHLTKESFARTMAVRGALEKCAAAGPVGKDRLLDSYVQGALRHMGA
ncbi:armadillo-like helical domain-containing protein [Nannochloropsis oceanica]